VKVEGRINSSKQNVNYYLQETVSAKFVTLKLGTPQITNQTENSSQLNVKHKITLTL